MSAYHDPIQGTVVGICTVVCALLHSTFDALVCIVVHNLYLLLCVMVLVWYKLRKAYIFPAGIIDISAANLYNISGKIYFSTKMYIKSHKALEKKGNLP